MRKATVWLGVTAALALGAGAQEPAAPMRTPIAETRHFAFFSDFDFNLYDALLRAAAARAVHQSEGMEGGEVGECFDELSREQRSGWSEAVDYFATNVASTWDFSTERYVFRAHLAKLPIPGGAGRSRSTSSRPPAGPVPTPWAEPRPTSR